MWGRGNLSLVIHTLMRRSHMYVVITSCQPRIWELDGIQTKTLCCPTRRLLQKKFSLGGPRLRFFAQHSDPLELMAPALLPLKTFQELSGDANACFWCYYYQRLLTWDALVDKGSVTQYFVLRIIRSGNIQLQISVGAPTKAYGSSCVCSHTQRWDGSAALTWSLAKMRWASALNSSLLKAVSVP